MLTDQQRSFLSHVKPYDKHLPLEVSQLYPLSASVSGPTLYLQAWNYVMVGAFPWQMKALSGPAVICGRASEPPTRFSSFPQCAQQAQRSPAQPRNTTRTAAICVVILSETSWILSFDTVPWGKTMPRGCMETTVELLRRVVVLQTTISSFTIDFPLCACTQNHKVLNS